MTDLTVKPVDEYDVDVEETVKRIGKQRGFEFDVSEFEQPMLSVRTTRKVGENTWSTHKFEIEADLICTQEELNERVREKIREMEESV